MFEAIDVNNDTFIERTEMQDALQKISKERLTRMKWIDLCLRMDAIPAEGLQLQSFHRFLMSLPEKQAGRWHRHSTIKPGPPPVKKEPKQNVSAGVQPPAVVHAKKKQRIEGVVKKAAPALGKTGDDVLVRISNASKEPLEKRRVLLKEVQSIVNKVGNLFDSQAAGAPALTIDDMKALATSVLADEDIPMEELTQDNVSSLGLEKGTEMHEGDMLLLPGKASLLQRGVMDTWPENIVPYCLDPDLDDAGKAAFLGAVEEYQKYVPCLTFKEVGVAGPEKCEGAEDAIYVVNTYSGCWSYVGPTRFTGKSQPLNLGPGCAFHGIAVHEMGHAVGMGHEHSRPDRNTYVKIRSENVRDGQIDQFVMEKTGSTKEEYCEDSVMHYGASAFGKYHTFPDGSTTRLQTIEVFSGGHIGQRMGLAACDIVQLRNMYKCPGTFKLPTIEKFEVTGACEEQEMNGIYQKRGETTDGRPWYEHVAGGKFLYYDSNCDGQGAYPRWQFDGDQPSETRSHDLDSDDSCVYAARLNVKDKTPPLGQRHWTVYCNGWIEQTITIQNVTDPNATAVTWKGSGEVYKVPELLTTEPAMHQTGLPGVSKMTLHFSTHVRPGEDFLNTKLVPKDLRPTGFADVAIQDKRVDIFFPRPLAAGTVYTLEMAYGALMHSSSPGRSPSMKAIGEWATAPAMGQKNLSQGLIIWNQYGVFLDDSLSGAGF